MRDYFMHSLCADLIILHLFQRSTKETLKPMTSRSPVDLMEPTLKALDKTLMPTWELSLLQQI